MYTNTHMSPPFSPLGTGHCFVLSLYKYLFLCTTIVNRVPLKKIIENSKYFQIQHHSGDKNQEIHKNTTESQKNLKIFPKPIP